MKRFLGILLALMLVLTMTACSISDIIGSPEPINYDKSEFEEVGGVKIAENGKYSAGSELKSSDKLGKFIEVAEGGDGDGFGIGNVYLSGSERTEEEEETYNGDDGGLGKFENGEKIKLFFRWAAWNAEESDRLVIFVVPNYLDIKDSYEIAAYKDEVAVCGSEEEEDEDEEINAIADLESLCSGEKLLALDPNWWNSGYFNMVFVFKGEVLGYIPFEWVSSGESIDYSESEEDSEPVSVEEYLNIVGLCPEEILPEGYTDAVVKADNAVHFNPRGADVNEWKAQISGAIKELSDDGKCGDLSDVVSFEYKGSTYWIFASTFSETEWFVQITK